MTTMTLREFTNEINSFTLEKYPDWLFGFSESKIAIFRRLYKNNKDWKLAILDSIGFMSKSQNFGIYWYDRGYRDPLLIEIYKSTIAWRFCKVCNKLYNKDTVFTSTNFKAINTCSLDCNVESRLAGNAKLSAAKFLYNSRDPIQYSERHGVDIETAKNKISSFVNAGSHWRPEFWETRGYTNAEAKERISDFQRINSQYSIIAYIKADRSIEERQNDNPRHINFYIKRGIPEEIGIKRIADVLSRSEYYSKYCVSKIGTEFCEKLSHNFNEDILYHANIDKEFYLFCNTKRGIYFYDFANITKKFIVEFNGDYWHSIQNKFWDKEYDATKLKCAEDAGYKVFVVWESEYNSDKELCISNTTTKINDWIHAKDVTVGLDLATM